MITITGGDSYAWCRQCHWKLHAKMAVTLICSPRCDDCGSEHVDLWVGMPETPKEWINAPSKNH